MIRSSAGSNEPAARGGTGRAPGERGSALVEFALTSLLFFTVVFGTLEFGRVIFEYNSISVAVREGARWASVRGAASASPASGTQVADYVVSRAFGALAAGEISVSGAGGNPGTAVTVTATHTYNTLFARLVRRTSITLSSSTQLIIAR